MHTNETRRNFRVKFKINVHDFYNANHYKTFIVTTIYNHVGHIFTQFNHVILVAFCYLYWFIIRYFLICCLNFFDMSYEFYEYYLLINVKSRLLIAVDFEMTIHMTDT